MSQPSRLMLSCQKTAHLLSDSMDRSLPFSVKMRLYLHLRLCKVCLLYQQQIQLLHRLFRTGSADQLDIQQAEPPSLSVGAKQRIKRAIDASRHSPDSSA